MNPTFAMETWMERLLMITFQASLLVPLILLVQWLLRDHLSARWRHAFWWLLVLRLLLPVSFTTPVSIFNLTQFDREQLPPITTPAQPKQATPISHADSSTAPLANEAPAQTEFATAPASTATEQTASIPRTVALDPPITTGNPVVATANSNANQLVQIAGGIWLTGVVILLSVVAFQTFRFIRRLKRSRKFRPVGLVELLEQARRRMEVCRPVELLETSAVNSPVIHGFFKPRILLPLGFEERFSREELTCVLFHELAHVKRRDLWSNWMITLLQLVHWFNPLVWLAFARMRSDRELACDELALQLAGEDSAPVYGRTIIKILESFSRPSAMSGVVGILEDKKQMKRRIQMIAEYNPPGRWSALAVVALGCLGLVTLTDGQSPVGSTSNETVEAFTTIDLTSYYDKGERSDFDGHDNGWATFPKGDQVFQGIPFNARGMVMLSGRSLAAIKNFPLQKSISDVPVNRKFEQLHLLQGAAFRAEQGTVLAHARIDYADGTWTLLPIAYGVHTADLWRSCFEPPVELAANSRLGWVARPPSVANNGLSTRMFLTSFDNPHPDRVVETVSVQSTDAVASVIVVGITVGRSLNAAERASIPELVDPQEPRDAALDFKVVFGDSLRPVAGVRLEVKGFYRRFDANLGEFVSGPDGVVRIPYSSEMDWMSVTTLDGKYASMAVRWNPKQGEAIPEQFTMRLQPGMEVGGVVEDDQGRPIEGAAVNVSSIGNPGQIVEPPVSYRNRTSAITDFNGRWRAGGLAASSPALRIYVSHPAYTAKQRVTDSAPEQYSGDRLSLNELRAGTARVELSGGEVVVGTVVDSSSRPIVGATVTIGDSHSYAGRKPTATDASGRFELSGIGPGRQLVAVRAEGYTPAFEWREVGKDEGPIGFQLEPGHSYSGRVTQPNGQPVGGAYVRVEQWNGMSHLNEITNTDPDGYYRLNSLPESGLVFTVNRVGYITATGLPAADDPEQNNFVLKPIVAITGTVTDATTGEPIPAFTVVPGDSLDLTGGGFRNWRTYQEVGGRDGRFTFEFTESRPAIVLKIQAEGYLPQVSEPVSEEDAPKELHFDLVKGTGPEGVVVFADGRPAPGVEVAFAADGLLARVSGNNIGGNGGRDALVSTTDAAGRFKFPPQLDGRLLAAASPLGFGEVPVDPATQKYRIVLRTPGTIRGRVRLPGVDVSGTVVALGLGSLNIPDKLQFDFNDFRAPVDAEGRFTIAGVPAGTRSVVLLRRVGERVWKHVLTREVEVNSGEVSDIVLEQSGRIVIGRVVASDPSLPVLWQDAALQGTSPQPPTSVDSTQAMEAWRQSPLMQNARYSPLYFGEDGKFSSLPVEPGTYQLDIVAVDPDSVNANGLEGRMIGHLNREVVIAEGSAPIDLGDVEVRVRKPIKVGMAPPDFVAKDAAGEPFSLANFRGRRVLVQFGDLVQLDNLPEPLKSAQEAAYTVMRQAADRELASVIHLTTQESFASSVEMIVGKNLPLVIGVVDGDALQELQYDYQISGTLIIGPDGKVEHILPANQPVELATRLEQLLLR